MLHFMLICKLFDGASLSWALKFYIDTNTSRQCVRNDLWSRSGWIITVPPLCVYVCVCDLVIMPQCDALARLITCQQVLCIWHKHIRVHTQITTQQQTIPTGQVSTLLQEAYCCLKGAHTHINGPMQRLEHRLSIKECIRRTQGSGIETVCVPLERDFMLLSGVQRYWVRAQTQTGAQTQTFIIQWTLQHGRIMPAGGIICRNYWLWVCHFPAPPYLSENNVFVIKQFSDLSPWTASLWDWKLFKRALWPTRILVSHDWFLFWSSSSATSYLSMCACVTYLSQQCWICDVMSSVNNVFSLGD